MNPPSPAIRYLRGTLILLGMALAGGMVAGWLTYQRHVAADLAQRKAQAQRNEIQSRLARASQEEAELRSKIAIYESLSTRGIVGNERRLDWIEQMSLIRAERRLPDLKYELSPRHAVENSLLPSGPEAGGMKFMTSTVKLDVTLLHEGDLVTLLADIRERIPARVSVRSCSVSRQGPLAAQDASSSQLYAQCELEWITILAGNA